ncbi:MAG TPA: phosphotransferase [Mycobacteriales bacterium]|nr:phosphotransferase [Mycobacteriales bacterium]
MRPESVMEMFAIRGVPAGWRRLALGGNGEVWRLDVAEPVSSWAVKRSLFGEWSDDRARLAFQDAAVAAGIVAVRPRISLRGRYVETIDGRSVRVAAWVPGRPPAGDDPGCAEWLGRTLGILHGLDFPTGGFAAPAAESVPEACVWPDLVERARAAELPWAEDLRAAVPGLVEIAASWSDDQDAVRVVSHRDVQPANVVADSVSGEFTLLDWDGVGLVNPARELVSRLVTWHVHDGAVDEAGIGRTMTAYRESGGRAVPRPADAFGGAPDALAYLVREVRLSIEADPVVRAHAISEVRALLDEQCPPAVLRRVLEVVGGLDPAGLKFSGPP